MLAYYPWLHTIETTNAIDIIKKITICNLGFNKERKDCRKSFFECSNYEKTTQEATFTEDVCETLYELGKEFDIPT